MADANWKTSLSLVVVAALTVYCAGHWASLTNRYVINDDVRQQLFWMQQWQDPELFRGDLLAEYSRNYVPWGVRLIYYAGAPLMDPVQLSKVVTGILYVITAVLLFGLGRYLRDDLTGLLLVGMFLVSTNFLFRISGGLSRAFAFPLLATYILCLAQRRLAAASFTILLQSLLNPYIMLLCLVTHCLYQARRYAVPLWHHMRGISLNHGDPRSSTTSLSRLFRVNLPVVAAVAVMALNYVVFADPSFGSLVSWTDMGDKIEYTEAGRYPILPVPSLVDELKRPYWFMLPFRELGIFPYGLAFSFFVGAISLYSLVVWIRRPEVVQVSRLWVFVYLLAASVILYAVAYVLLMKLFLPRRYLEYSLAVFYAALFAIGLRVLVEMVVKKKTVVLLLLTVSVVVGVVRFQHVGIYDYSASAPLCRFLAGVPKDSVVAGPPDLMDNIMTFAHRRVFVSFELSHTWYKRYWKTIKKRTFDLLRAYYAADPAEISRFAQDNHVDYLVVREKDFPPGDTRKGSIHFEPFDSFVRTLTRSQEQYAALDRNAFPVVFEDSGLRVLRIRRRRQESEVPLLKPDSPRDTGTNAQRKAP
jgi:preprotein translocase subunit SecE